MNDKRVVTVYSGIVSDIYKNCIFFIYDYFKQECNWYVLMINDDFIEKFDISNLALNDHIKVYAYKDSVVYNSDHRFVILKEINDLHLNASCKKDREAIFYRDIDFEDEMILKYL